MYLVSQINVLKVITTYFVVEYTTYIVLFLHSQHSEIRHSESLKCHIIIALLCEREVSSLKKLY